VPYAVTTIGEVAAVKGGKRLAKGEGFAGTVTDHPYIRARDIRDGKVTFDDPIYITPDTHQRLARYITNHGDVCITIVGANVGDVGVVPRWLDGANLTENAVKVRGKADKAIQQFLLYALLSEYSQKQMKLLAGGAAQPKLGIYRVNSVEIPCPPLPIQKKIAAVLSAYDDLIENHERRIKILEDMAQNLYREWFVSFRFPGHDKVKMVDSPLGMIPEGWNVHKYGDRLELLYGKALKAADRKGGAVPVYGSSGIVGYHDKALVQGPGIIVGRKGNVGSVHWSPTGFFPIDTVFYVSARVPLHYLYFNLGEQTFINTDAAVPGLNRNTALAKLFILPSEDVMSEFEEWVEPLCRSTELLRHRIGTLRRTRDLLLPKLISGQLDVSELNIEVPEEAA